MMKLVVYLLRYPIAWLDLTARSRTILQREL